MCVYVLPIFPRGADLKAHTHARIPRLLLLGEHSASPRVETFEPGVATAATAELLPGTWPAPLTTARTPGIMAPIHTSTLYFWYLLSK